MRRFYGRVNAPLGSPAERLPSCGGGAGPSHRGTDKGKAGEPFSGPRCRARCQRRMTDGRVIEAHTRTLISNADVCGAARARRISPKVRRRPPEVTLLNAMFFALRRPHATRPHRPAPGQRRSRPNDRDTLSAAGPGRAGPAHAAAVYLRRLSDKGPRIHARISRGINKRRLELASRFAAHR